MLATLIWMIAFLIFVLWSLGCWGIYAITVWVIESTRVIAEGSAVLNASQMSVWLQNPMPPELAETVQLLNTTITPMIQSLLNVVPALDGLIALIFGVVWCVGVLLIIVFALGARMLVGSVERKQLVSKK